MRFKLKASKLVRVREIILSTLGSLYNLDQGLLYGLFNLLEENN
jgi:hypothetical protein